MEFKDRAISWAVSHPEELVFCGADKPKVARLHDFTGDMKEYFVGDRFFCAPMKVVLDDWDETVAEMTKVLDMTPLPYEFDLLYDIKCMYEVEMVCEGKCPAGTHATPEDLLDMFISHKMEIPEFLSSAAKPRKNDSIWIHIDGTWTLDKPLYDEIHNYIESKVDLTEGFIKQMEIRNGNN